MAMTVVAITVAVLLAAVAQFLRHSNKEVDGTTQDADEDSEELLDTESSPLMGVPAVSALSFYSLSTNADGYVAVEAHLRQRVQAIVALNPWLCGRLTKRMGKVHVVFPRTTAAVEAAARAAFTVMDDKELHHELNYEVLSTRLAHLAVKAGKRCVDASRHEPLFKVVLIRTRPKANHEQLALLVSVSHLLVDGHAFYTLYGMLGSAGVPASLVVKRRQTFTQEVTALMGGSYEIMSWFQSVGAIASVVGTLSCAPRARAIVQPISDQFVERCKEAHERAASEPSVRGTMPPYVSTNDVIVHTLLQRSGCTIGMMPVNFRGKIAGLTAQHAGNYVGILGYLPVDVATPADIRASLAGPLYRRVRHDVPFPSSWWASSQARVCMVNNWASLYVDAALPGCNQTFHVPLTPVDRITIRDTCYIFRAKRAGEKDGLQVLALTRSFDAASLAQALSGGPTNPQS